MRLNSTVAPGSGSNADPAAVLALILSSLLWGLSWFPLKLLHAQNLPGVAMIAISYGALGLASLPWAWRERAFLGAQRTSLLAIALLGGYANLAFSLALIYGEVVRVMVLFYLLPVWGVLGGWWFLRERLDWTRLSALVLAVAGALTILGDPQMLISQVSWVDWMAISSGLALAANNILFRFCQSLPLMSKVHAMAVGSCGMAAVPILVGLVAIPAVTPDLWLWVILYGVTWQALAIGAGQWGVSHLEAGTSSVIIILELLIATFSAVWLGDETLDMAEVLGATLVVTAALLEATRRSASSASPTPEDKP